jgi:hypothetical protein
MMPYLLRTMKVQLSHARAAPSSLCGYGRDHLRMVIAATSSSDIAHAAFDAAVVQYGGERLTLRRVQS